MCYLHLNRDPKLQEKAKAYKEQTEAQAKELGKDVKNQADKFGSTVKSEAKQVEGESHGIEGGGDTEKGRRQTEFPGKKWKNRSKF